MLAGRRVRRALGSLSVWAWLGTAHALGQDEALSRAERELAIVERGLAGVRSDLAARTTSEVPPEKRIAAGELSLRAKDYERAIDALSQVLELHRQGQVGASAHADALFLLGEAYFESKQLLSARRLYSEIIALGERPPYDAYAGRSLARLVDVALGTETTSTLDDLGARAARLSISDATGSFAYARGKLAFARRDFAGARALLAEVPAGSEYHHQAQYLLGTLLVEEVRSALGVEHRSEPGTGLGPEPARAPIPLERFAEAIAQFQRVTELPRDSSAHEHVVDLAWMALGRIHYECEHQPEAARAYAKVERTSPEFHQALYELAWVHVRLGDFQRAQRALEILAIAAPERLDIADGALLRGDLLLRSGRLETALDAYREVRERFEPARAEVERFIATTSDPAAYYDRLIEDELELVGNAKVPEAVLGWVRDAARSARAFAVIDDVGRARELLRRSRERASKLRAVLSAPTRARAFPELQAALEKSIGLTNRLARARRALAQGLDDAGDPVEGSPLERARGERRALMADVGRMPVTAADFARRQGAAERSWSGVSQGLQRVTLEADKLQALINGLRRLLAELHKHGVSHDAASRARFASEVAAHERELAGYLERIAQFQQQIEAGRLQVGFGDRRYADDEAVRKRFRRAVDQELALSAAAGGEASEYARRVAPVLARMERSEQRLEATRAALEARAAEGARELLRQVSEEIENLERQTLALEALDREARSLVGEVAMRSFARVKERLESIVLRADVGVVQQAWGLREEQRARLVRLQRKRALEEEALERELKEVLDEPAEEP